MARSILLSLETMSGGVLKEASCSCIEAIFVAPFLESSACVSGVSALAEDDSDVADWLGCLFNCSPMIVSVGDCIIVVRINPTPIRPRGKEMSKKSNAC